MNLGAILTAMVTPFDAHGRVDDEAAVRLMNHLVEHGSDGLVVCGTTGEASTLADEEQLSLIALAVQEMRGRCTIIAGVGSNDTHHAVHLTERATALRPDALLSVNPYYNKPSRRGIVRHYEEINRATDLPILLYNIPQRTGFDMPNDLLAELGELEHIAGVKQANPDNLALIDGLELYSGNDDTLADVLDMGGAGGILVASHLFGEQMRQMVDEPDRRREIDDSLTDVYRDLTVAPLACSVKSALRLIGLDVGAPRLPYVELDDARARDRPRHARAPRTAADCQGVNGARLRVLPLGGLGEIGKNMMVVEYDDRIVVVDTGLRFPTAEMLGIDLVLPDFSYLRQRADRHRGDRGHARTRRPPGSASLGAPGALGRAFAAGLRRPAHRCDGTLQARRAPG